MRIFTDWGLFNVRTRRTRAVVEFIGKFLYKGLHAQLKPTIRPAVALLRPQYIPNLPFIFYHRVQDLCSERSQNLRFFISNLADGGARELIFVYIY